MTPTTPANPRRLVACLLLLAGCSGTETAADSGPYRVTIRGLLLNEGQETVLVDCASQRRFRFGDIPDGRLYHYRRRIEGILEKEKTRDITAEVSGYLTRAGDLVLQKPAILHLVPGNCVEGHEEGADRDH